MPVWPRRYRRSQISASLRATVKLLSPPSINRSTREPRHSREWHAVVGLYLLMATHIYIHVSRFQSGNRGLKMGSISGLDHDLEQHRLGWQIGESALMGNLNDVGARLAEDRDDGGQLTGPIDDIEFQLRQAALPRELTGQHAGQQQRIDGA